MESLYHVSAFRPRIQDPRKGETLHRGIMAITNIVPLTIMDVILQGDHEHGRAGPVPRGHGRADAQVHAEP